jgi:hypothetical protein
MKTSLNINKIAVVSGLFLGAFALSALAASWTPPRSNPPADNTDAPINVGMVAQYKSGALAVGKTSAPAIGFDLDVDGLGFFYGLKVSGNGMFSGNVGIGTDSPTKKLEVVGGPIKATGGLIIETISSDPVNPESGRMWLVIP